jgi:hypothetical protein
MATPRTIPLGRKGGGKSIMRVRKVVIGKGRVAVTIYLAKKDALRLAKEIWAEWPSKSKS